jgi:hypothetical protein
MAQVRQQVALQAQPWPRCPRGRTGLPIAAPSPPPAARPRFLALEADVGRPIFRQPSQRQRPVADAQARHPVARSVWSRLNSTVWPFRAAPGQRLPRKHGSITAAASSKGFFSKRLSHCSRMSCRSVSRAAGWPIPPCPASALDHRAHGQRQLPRHRLAQPWQRGGKPALHLVSQLFTVPIGKHRLNAEVYLKLIGDEGF